MRAEKLEHGHQVVGTPCYGFDKLLVILQQSGNEVGDLRFGNPDPLGERAQTLALDVVELVEVHCVGRLAAERGIDVVDAGYVVVTAEEVFQGKLHRVCKMCLLAKEEDRHGLRIRAQSHRRADDVCGGRHEAILIPKPFPEEGDRSVEQGVLSEEAVLVPGLLKDRG